MGYEIVKTKYIRRNNYVVDFLHINLSAMSVRAIVHPLRLNINCYSITKVDLFSNLSVHYVEAAFFTLTLNSKILKMKHFNFLYVSKKVGRIKCVNQHAIILKQWKCSRPRKIFFPHKCPLTKMKMNIVTLLLLPNSESSCPQLICCLMYNYL